jgi:hypothetical protein
MGAADERTEKPHAGFWTKTRSIVWLIIPAICLIVIVFPHGGSCGGLTQGRQAATEALLCQLSQAVAVYELDHERYPPGDGSGSTELVTCLRKPGAKKLPYMDLPSEMVDGGGNLLNPVRESGVIHYRCPGLHNPKTFDLWCEDAKGRTDGINNWRK